MFFKTEPLKKIIHTHMTPVNTFLNVPIYTTFCHNELVYKDTTNPLLFCNMNEHDSHAMKVYLNSRSSNYRKPTFTSENLYNQNNMQKNTFRFYK